VGVALLPRIRGSGGGIRGRDIIADYCCGKHNLGSVPMCAKTHTVEHENQVNTHCLSARAWASAELLSSSHSKAAKAASYLGSQSIGEGAISLISPPPARTLPQAEYRGNAVISLYDRAGMMGHIDVDQPGPRSCKAVSREPMAAGVYGRS
jgi:hypothetical protein